MRPTDNKLLNQFLRDSRASLTVEAVIMLPLLLLWFVATFAFFDIFRINVLNEKASDAITDLITRYDPSATTPLEINDAFIDGMNDVFDQIVQNGGNTWIRVSSVGFDTDTNAYTLRPSGWDGWSTATRGRNGRTEAEIAALSDRLPVIPAGASLVVVETYIDYTMPIFWSMGLPRTMEFSTLAVARPRFTTAGEGIPFGS